MAFKRPLGKKPFEELVLFAARKKGREEGYGTVSNQSGSRGVQEAETHPGGQRERERSEGGREALAERDDDEEPRVRKYPWRRRRIRSRGEVEEVNGRKRRETKKAVRTGIRRRKWCVNRVRVNT